MKEGTLHEKSAPVATKPSQTASGVGMVGGTAGLNAATMKPTVGCVCDRQLRLDAASG